MPGRGIPRGWRCPVFRRGDDSMRILSIPFPGLAGAGRRGGPSVTWGGAVAERAWCSGPSAGRGRWDCSWAAAMTACTTLTVVLLFIFLWLSSRWKGQVGGTKPYVPDGSLCGLVWRFYFSCGADVRALPSDCTTREEITAALFMS